tara:strand:- start:558 stop:8795 length:8238 start_codon:yes stop_codon:yes gene_type:complete
MADGDGELESGTEDAGEEQNEVIPSDDASLNKYFFAAKPPESPLKIKSSVVIRLPIYSKNGYSNNNVSSNPSIIDSPLTFENLYRFYKPDDVARLLVEGGIISKSIRYGLLYNYFGIPAANLSTGFWADDSDNQYTAFSHNKTRKRVATSDSEYSEEVFGSQWATEAVETYGEKKFAEAGGFFTEYAQGLYQYGRLGNIAPFEGAIPDQASISYKSLKSLDILQKSVDINYSEQDSLIRNIYEVLNAVPFNGAGYETVGTFAFVEPIGVDAQYTGFKVDNDPLLTAKSSLSSLLFNGGWGVHTNPVPKTYARAWYPASKSHYINNVAFSFDFVESTETSATANLAWKSPQYGAVEDGNLNSLALTVGEYGVPDWSGWYMNPQNWLNATDSPSEAAKEQKFENNNIASMYGLVPNKEINSVEYNNYRRDPSLTLNEIYPHIMKYVNDVVPLYMVQQDKGWGDDYNWDYDHNDSSGTPLNKSDVITSSLGITPQSVLRKFRIGHFDYTGEGGSPPPSSMYTKLGYTHIIGRNGNPEGSAYDDFIDSTGNTESNSEKLFRDKISVNLKTNLHREYLLDPINSNAAKGAYNHTSIYDIDPTAGNVEGIFDPLSHPFIPDEFKQKYDENTLNMTRLQKSYYLSTSLLSYLYLKIPAGYNADNDVTSIGNPTTNSPVNFSAALWNEGNKSKVNLPTILDLSADTPESTTKDLLDGLDAGGGAWYSSKLEELFESAIQDNEFSVGSADTGGSFHYFVTAKSQFALPIWKYDAGSDQDIGNINWRTITDTSDKKSDLADALLENSTIENITNFGIPSWVKSLRIYPCPDKEIIVTNPYTDGKNTSTPNFETYKSTSAKMQDVASAALKIVIEPKFDDEGNSSQSGAGDFDGYVEIRYVTEFEIDEKKLILDLVGQGVASLGGTKEEYIEAGFKIGELIEKTNGNLYDDELKGLYEAGGYNFGSGIGADFGNFSTFSKGGGKDCFIHPPPIIAARADKIILESGGDEYACTSYICLSDTGCPTVEFKKEPGPQAENIGYLSDNTIVKVLKEWVNGKGEYNKILVVDPTSTYIGKTGYIEPHCLKVISPRAGSTKKIFFEQIFDEKLAKTDVMHMSDMARTLIRTWYRDMDQPYYHRLDGEHWVSVTMPYNCIIDEDDLTSQMEEAKKIGLKKVLDFYNKSVSDSDIDKLVDTYLAVKSEDYYIDSRPGSKVKVLVKVGGIYVNAFPSKTEVLEDLKEQSAKIISLNSKYFELHLEQSIYSLNKIYLDIFSSQFTVTGVDFTREAERLSYVPIAIKKMIAVNGFDVKKQTDSIINIGFDNQFGVTFVSYIDDASTQSNSEESLLSIGLEYYKNLEPFTFPNTMSLLYHHRELKSPMLPWRTVVEEWLPDPKPKVLPKTKKAGAGGGSDLPVERCSRSWFQFPSFSQIMMGIAEDLDQKLDLHPRYDLGAFQFNLLQFFPPCPSPPSGKGTSFFKFLSEIDGETTVAQNGEFLEAMSSEAERVVQYVGDFLSSGAALKDIRDKIFDLDDLYSYVLNYITPEVLYSKVCKCFLDVMDFDDIRVPNLSIDASGGSGGLNLDPSTIAHNPKDVFNSEGAAFDTNFIDEDGNFANKDSFMEKISTEDLLCSFCFNIPSIFFRLPTTDLLQTLLDALKAILEFVLSQLLLELIAALLDALLTCPDLVCSTGETRVKDYGAQSAESIIKENGPISVEECGLDIAGTSVTDSMVSSMLADVSSVLTSSEMLGLFDGSAPKVALEAVQGVVFTYSHIYMQLDSIPRIAEFFACIGSKLKPSAFDYLEDAIKKKVSDPVLCASLIEQTKSNLADKCGNIPGLDQIANKNLNHDLDKYKTLANLIRENDNLSSQLPPMFSDGKGTQSIMSGLNVESADHALDQTLETLMIPIEGTIIGESNKLFSASANVLVKEDSNLKELLSFPPLIALGMLVANPWFPDMKNKLAELKVFGSEEGIPINIFLSNLSQGLNFLNAKDDNIIKADLNDSSYIHLLLNPPEVDQSSGFPQYKDNYSFLIKSQKGLSFDISGENSGINPELKSYLEKFPLKLAGEGSPERPEQSQFFANLLLSNITNQKVDASDPNSTYTPEEGEFADVMKDFLMGDLYYSIIGTVVNKMGEACSDSNMLKDFDASPFAKDQTVLKILEGLLEGLTPITLPEFKRLEVENVKLTSPGMGATPNCMVDINYAKQLAKKAYDFSKFYDPNSPVIGMPHFALLEAIVSSTIQLFAGETFAKGIFVLSFFPKEVFTNEATAVYVFEQFNNWLKGQPDFEHKWKAIITRMVYERTEFTAIKDDSGASPFPGLPGESGTTIGSIHGTIHDTSSDKEYEIKNWQDATMFYVRQNLERPLIYIKERLKQTTLDSHDMDKETSPFSYIASNKIKEVHDSMVILSESDGGKSKQSSSLFEPTIKDDFLNGSFVFQFYFRLEELEEGNENDGTFNTLYNKHLVDRDLGISSTEGGDIVFGTFSPDESLKGLLNRNNINRLWKNMTSTTTTVMDGNYGIPISDQDNKFYDFFKSVKLGVRLCYAVTTTTQAPALDADVSQSPEIKELFNSVENLLNENSIDMPELLEYSKREKSLFIQEEVFTAGEENEYSLETSLIFPAISREIELKGDTSTPFALPVYGYAESGIPLEIDLYISSGKGAKVIQDAVADILGSVEMQALFSYSIPIPKLSTMLMIYNNLGLEGDESIINNFNNTKDILKQTFESIYDVKGNKSYAYQPPLISKQGGPRGIANAAQNKNK